jgi:6-phosphogluconate dehydrogenase
MRLGMIGLGRMGANMVRRLIKQGHNCVVFDRCQNLWTIWSRRRRQLPARSLAPGMGSIPRTIGREKIDGTAEEGYLHCGPNGAGHFVKTVHNGMEYGIMAAYAEGLAILRAANVGKQANGAADAETTPLGDPEHYRYDLNLRDIAEVWRRGSVIASWLLDLTANALLQDPSLSKFAGHVSDSGEGRWTIKAAIDEAVPAPVLTSALYERFSSRGEADFANKLLSAMRYQFGGHIEKSDTKSKVA